MKELDLVHSPRSTAPQVNFNVFESKWNNVKLFKNQLWRLSIWFGFKAWQTIYIYFLMMMSNGIDDELVEHATALQLTDRTTSLMRIVGVLLLLGEPGMSHWL